MKDRGHPAAVAGEFAGWCGQSISAPTTVGSSGFSLRAEAPGYVAMIAFLSAYLLSVAGVGHLVQAALNLTGAAVGAAYLHKKNALPSVISNLVWAAITIAGIIFSF
jgi:hypothetical protein